MKKIIYIVMLSVLLSACGVKKGYVVGDYGKQPLCGEVVGPIESADSSLAGRSTLGLWWQRDSLQITLSQGRRLKAARTKGDTLYLYETQRDMMDVTTRQYTIYIPQQELYIIKYNDSLVYPIMPAAKRCEYPLEIKSMGRKNIDGDREKKKERIEEEQKKQEPYKGGGVMNVSSFPLELWEGRYHFNAGAYQLGSDCKCKTDSFNVLVLHIDGTWQRYKNNTLKNCGIMRKGWHPVCYELENYDHRTVLFLDTTSIAGHIISLKEDKRRWKENISYQHNEYRWVGKGNVYYDFVFIQVHSVNQDNIMTPYFWGTYTGNIMLEGSRCGWQRIK